MKISGSSKYFEKKFIICPIITNFDGYCKYRKTVLKLLSNIRLFGLLAGVLALAVPGHPAYARKMRIDIQEEARALVTEQKLRRDIEFLADSLCAGRATGTAGGMETATWIARRFAKLGLEPLGDSYIHGFKTTSSAAGRNVLGIVSGGATPAKKYVILMASYDGLGIRGGNIYPGADSNASGVAAMLALAEMISLSRDLGREYNIDFIFAGIDAKYLSFSGSTALWNEISTGCLYAVSGHRLSTGSIKLVLNIDQIGSSLSPLKSGRKDYLILLTEGFGIKEALQANKSKGTALELSFDYYGSKDFTNVFYRKAGDQKVFVEHGIRAALATSGITLNNNKLTDTVDNLDLPVLKRRIWFLWNWAQRIAGIDDKIQDHQ